MKTVIAKVLVGLFAQLGQKLKCLNFSTLIINFKVVTSIFSGKSVILYIPCPFVHSVRQSSLLHLSGVEWVAGLGETDGVMVCSPGPGTSGLVFMVIMLLVMK